MSTRKQDALVRPKVTLHNLNKSYGETDKLVMLTAYDWTSARLAGQAGADILLVGDSLGMVIQGRDNTLQVTLEHMVYHTACVSRAQQPALLVADMPYGTFHVSVADTVKAGLRLVQEGGAEAVKVEGAGPRLAHIHALLDAEIPVMGHLGLTPQSVHKLGGYRVQGRGEDAAKRLLEQARQLEQAGVFALVLECVPPDLATEITQALSIPTIGIGAGPGCSGQVLVFHDLLGLNGDFHPVFVRRYLDGETLLGDALKRYCQDVRQGTFPSDQETYKPNQKPVKATPC